MERIFRRALVRLAPEGKMDEGRRKAHSVSEADLGEALQQAGLESPAQAQDVVLEPSGKLIAFRSDAP